MYALGILEGKVWYKFYPNIWTCLSVSLPPNAILESVIFTFLDSLKISVNTRFRTAVLNHVSFSLMKSCYRDWLWQGERQRHRAWNIRHPFYNTGICHGLHRTTHPQRTCCSTMRVASPIPHGLSQRSLLSEDRGLWLTVMIMTRLHTAKVWVCVTVRNI